MQANFVQELSVAESYRVREDGVLLEAGPVKKKYRPRDYPELPFEFAKLAGGDEKDLLNFVSDWGQIGGPETILWYQGHAQHIAVCLKLIDGLQRGDDEGLLEFLRGWLVSDDTHREVRRIPILPYANLLPQGEKFQCGIPDHVCRTELFWHAEASSHKRGLVLPAILVCDKELTRVPTEVAVWLLPVLVNPYLQGHLSGLVVQDGHPVMVFEFEDLLTMIYFHIAELAEKQQGLAKCQECGAFFHQTDRRQRFCPPTGDSHYKESQCGQKNRFKRQPKRTRSKKITALKQEKSNG